MQPSDLDTKTSPPFQSYPCKHWMAQPSHPDISTSRQSGTERYLSERTQMDILDANVQNEECQSDNGIAEKPPTVADVKDLVTNLTPPTPKNEDNIATDAGASTDPQSAAPNEAKIESPGFLPVLKNRNFLSLWSGQVFSQLTQLIEDNVI